MKGKLDGRILYYTALILSFPYVWILVAVDWENPFASTFVCWIGTPVAFLAVPTISFIGEVENQDVDISTRYLMKRYLWELFVCCPLWFIAWGFIEFCLLGWIWI